MSMKIQSFALVFFLIKASLALAQVANPDLLAQAKKEGRVTWYTTVSIPESKLFIDMFEKQYPFIKVDLLRSEAGALINRVTSEYAARNYSADVLQGLSSRGGLGLLKKREILGRYESPEFKHFPAEFRDKAGYWGSTFQNTFVLAYNKRNVKADDVPRTYEDLLKPMWKGRQIINDTDNFEWFDGLLRSGVRTRPPLRRLAAQIRYFSAARAGHPRVAAGGRLWRSATDLTPKATSARRPSVGCA
jgi:ABC-type thiamine transport system substrate-binding protein